jgi:hypothetical protein
MRLIIPFFLLLTCLAPAFAQKTKPTGLSNDNLFINWKNEKNGWRITNAKVKKDGKWVEALVPSG